MIRINNKDLVKATKNDYNFKEIYVNGQLIWPIEIPEYDLSCFAFGYWINENPWTDSLGWNNYE